VNLVRGQVNQDVRLFYVHQGLVKQHGSVICDRFAQESGHTLGAKGQGKHA